MKKFLMLLTCLLSINANAFCVVTSELNQEINPGLTAETICHDATVAFANKNGLEIPFSSLTLVVTFEQTSTVGIYYQFVNLEGQITEGSGYQHWQPGYSEFQILD